MIRRLPISILTDTLFPYSTLFRSIFPRHFGLVLQLVCRVLHGRGSSIVVRNVSLFFHHAGLVFQNISLIFAYVLNRIFLLRIASRSEEHTSELQSLMLTSYAVFCLKKTNKNHTTINHPHPNT